MTTIDLHTMRESLAPPSSVVCLGNFDGLHLGHRALIKETIAKKEQLKKSYPDIASGACFFKILPSDYFSLGVPHLVSFEQKLALFSELGLDYAFVTDFEELRTQSPEDYVKRTLKGLCGCVHAVCGFNFHFGSKAAGTAETLSHFMSGAISVIDPVCVNGELVSSSLIRRKIESGDVESAATLLGRPYTLQADVLHGKALGRTMGIPTVNQCFSAGTAIPKHGIYITSTIVNGVHFPSVSNVGIRPTVDNDNLINCETHILDFDQDIYGEKISIEFLSRLRDEIRFDSLAQLQQQIEQDILSARKYYKEA